MVDHRAAVAASVGSKGMSINFRKLKGLFILLEIGWEKKKIVLPISIIGLFVFWLFISMPNKKPTISFQVLQQPSEGKWHPVARISDPNRPGYLPDIISLAFDEAGLLGAAVSSEGMLLITRDGGANWQSFINVPLDKDANGNIEGEIVTSLSVQSDGLITIGVAVPESPYTAIYQLDSVGNWRRVTGDYGGIGSVTGNGQILVGGNGLIAHRQNDGWSFNKLPGAEDKMLYGTANADELCVVVGDAGFVAASHDGGVSWQKLSGIDIANDIAISADVITTSAFYAAAVSCEVLLVGGVNGSFWHRAKEKWHRIAGLSDTQTIFSILIDDESKEIFAAGGNLTGDMPFILNSTDGGSTWRYEDIDFDYGRVVAIARGRDGLFAATMDGQILIRHTTELSSIKH